MDQVLQVVGALLVLAGYVLAQARKLDQQSPLYLLLNLVGSALLAALALVSQQWGFLLLEGVWAMVSLWSLLAPTFQPANDRHEGAHRVRDS